MIPASKKVIIVGANPLFDGNVKKGCRFCDSPHSMWQLDHVESCTPCFEERAEEARRELMIEEGLDPDAVDPMEMYEEDEHDY